MARRIRAGIHCRIGRRRRDEEDSKEKAPRPLDERVDAWGTLLADFDWSWFTTNTFRKEVHPEAAAKCFNRWTHGLNRDVFGVRYWHRPGDGVIWVRGLEYQKRGVIHYHALIGRVPDRVRRLDYMDAWDQLAGYARIEPYDATKGARFYLGKYILKGGQIDLGGPLRFQQGLFQQKCFG